MTYAARLLHERLLWLLPSEDAPKVGRNVTSEVMSLERIGVAMSSSEIPESFASWVKIQGDIRF